MFRAELDPLRPYVPPKTWRMAAEGTDENGYAKLTSNELAFGPLPEAEAAVRDVLPRANRYPDSHVLRLREVVAEANPGIGTQNVLVGNGSSEVIFNALQLLPSGGEIVYPWPSFSLYPTISAVLGMKARPVELAEGSELDEEALLAAVTEKTRAVILCNPNNPSGTYLPLGRVRKLAGELPEDVMLIVDEAYVEFVDDPGYRTSHELALEHENVLLARTFSKAHGLAGLRVGYGLASEKIADYAERVRFPVSVNLAAQVAAVASMQAREKVMERARFVISERERLRRAFSGAGVASIPSQGNFIMVKFPAADFERSGVLVREGEALGYPGWSRVTVGSEGENDRVVAALSGVGGAAS
ncbi:Histidinol-phosphate/aromatic aminotransferase and cobyric acid decarboxylase [Rubrobacter radiotolerans]|uniref:Histidinol-phosphate aminotransferase n=1 Tax=Rubrobacter radiotolerans TaxID=42256 RepID=A0A023X4P7_RUBRA|nr:histidinol-phosphate transaminase [Rubrobacter radiotolerans]AHY47442.1 Histidinol-phosphate/aromatic aminotransferase and cobyric acid decarboxylase [Rubrobacter radiotolerans]MDX5894845.1 histidinol-phosphate transaminase [Rubrobacter radiotolerans]SMC06889.1 histidinol-phosphate aminotransferase [Rubrobacter radiotolerans DSM 5868]